MTVIPFDPHEELRNRIDPLFQTLKTRQNDPEFDGWSNALLFHDIGALLTVAGAFTSTDFLDDATIAKQMDEGIGSYSGASDIGIKINALDRIVEVFSGIDHAVDDFYSRDRIQALHQLFPILSASVHFFHELTPERFKELQGLSISLKDMLTAMDIPYHVDDLNMFAALPNLNGVETVVWFNMIKNAVTEQKKNNIYTPLIFKCDKSKIALSNLSLESGLVSYHDQDFPSEPTARNHFGRGIVSKLAVLEGLHIDSQVQPVQNKLFLHTFIVNK